MTDEQTRGSSTTPALDESFDTVWDELLWRGSVHVSTDPVALRALLAGEPITYYCGFDPTAPSLHLGNLVQLILMRRLQLAGHRPLGLVGGSTGLIGDPRPTAERTLNSRETVHDWVVRLQAQVSRFLAVDGENAMRLVNNLDWTAPLSAIDFLREIGKHFRVGTMLKKDAVSARLNSDAGISYTEFSYQILQGMDFLELYRQYGCVLQTGGSDQWGNLTSGTDLIHRAEGVSVHAIGTPLVMNSDGTKFGKSEGNAVWLDPELTSPYAFYQFWLNTDDRDAVDRLKTFTFLTRAEIERLEQAAVEAPFKREAQRALAWEVTSLVHGDAVTQAVVDASAALFGRGSLSGIDPVILRGALDAVPTVEVEPGTPVLQAFLETRLVASLGEARRALAQGGLSVNNEVVAEESLVLGDLPLIDGIAVLRRGKKSFAGAFVQ
ncbi:tyrosine--tRNA ligase [Rathayibacter sp. VKM Ac-2759]|uniref:tyrosine--tRNA ligase n=1 Tax=Rathayibacter sp. VKM Ac-2759 TaxID=2609252 RepID=UPI001316173A|nr:tyrosine--tRNA ligase [Rathayibacter sp. VKM Ac-2759]QHC66337.1 tyrosine--tRNA ligase [Rathayibacter sp. VKM Ac-2759]